MEKKSPALLFRPVSTYNNNNINTNTNLTPKKGLSLLDINSYDKENTPNKPVTMLSSSTSFLSQSSEDSYGCPNTSTTVEDAFTPVPIDKQSSSVNHLMRAAIRKESGLFCENINCSIDEAFLNATMDSLDQSGSYLSSSIDVVDYAGEARTRPSISETAYLMKSFSTDEMNAVRHIPSQTSHTMMGSKKLSLINPSAVKAISMKAAWQLSSPTDHTNMLSPTKALKRKYKSRSNEEINMLSDL